VVCGCGPSLKDFPKRPACITIGVNDVGRHFDPDYLVVVNPPSQFRPDRRGAIKESRARAVFTQYAEWRLQHAPLVPIAFGVYGGVDFSNPDVLHYTPNSPYVAVCLAIHMGAARIGLIGVDLTNDHFFGDRRSPARREPQPDRRRIRPPAQRLRLAQRRARQPERNQPSDLPAACKPGHFSVDVGRAERSGESPARGVLFRHARGRG
jgi:hypothetical protein